MLNLQTLFVLIPTNLQVNFLSQIRLSHKGDGPKAAKRLIDIYFALFKVLAEDFALIDTIYMSKLYVPLSSIFFIGSTCHFHLYSFWTDCMSIYCALFSFSFSPERFKVFESAFSGFNFRGQ